MRCSKMVALLFLLFLSGASQAQTVDWILGESPPASWSVSPVNPSTGDTITFRGPTDVYSNHWVGESDLGGTPKIYVDALTRTV
ncbi:hypothetical protein ACFL6U_14500 [Planctomycetota bacterium]